MEAAVQQSRTMTYAGWGLSVIVILFLVMDFTMKFMQLPIVISTTEQLGWPASNITTLAVLLLLSTALYAFPKTSVLGAILLTGYLGGAIATHLRIGSALFSHVLFGVYLALFVWGGLYLRDARIRALIPLR
ncbi:MAG: DoxX family protein [Proteobacteria bacterium]|nr:DoxX family protein [Pseudomonadota bacterium]